MVWVERKLRNILEIARGLRFQASLPIEFWGECVQTVVFWINRTPTTLFKGKYPYEILFSSQQKLELLRVFGYLCYVHYSPRTKDKFGPRSRRCVFLGYHSRKKRWKVMDLEPRDVFVSRDVRFMEDIFPFASMHDILEAVCPSPYADLIQPDFADMRSVPTFIPESPAVLPESRSTPPTDAA